MNKGCIWDCYLLLNRDVDYNSPDPPQIVDGRPPPNCYWMPSLSSGGFKMPDVCIYIHFWRLRRAVSRMRAIDMDPKLIRFLCKSDATK